MAKDSIRTLQAEIIRLRETIDYLNIEVQSAIHEKIMNKSHLDAAIVERDRYQAKSIKQQNVINSLLETLNQMGKLDAQI